MALDPQEREEGGHHEPVFNIAAAVLVIIALNMVVFGLQHYLLSPAASDWLLINGAFLPVRYFTAADWTWLTTPFSYGFLHASGAHLGFNMIWLAIFGSPLAARMGGARFVAFYLGAVAAAAFAHMAIDPRSIALLVGASGGVSGATGAAARYAFRVGRSHGIRAFAGRRFGPLEALRVPTVLAFCAIWFAVNALTGANVIAPAGEAQIAWVAHIGGFLFGYLLVGFFDPHRH